MYDDCRNIYAAKMKLGEYKNYKFKKIYDDTENLRLEAGIPADDGADRYK